MPLLDMSDPGTLAVWAFFTLLTFVSFLIVPPVGLLMALGLGVAAVASFLGVGDQRAQAGWRAASGAWLVTVGLVVGTIVVIVAAVWGLVDVILQLLLDRNVLSEGTRPAQWVAGTFYWAADQAAFAATGGGAGQFKAFPSPKR